MDKITYSMLKFRRIFITAFLSISILSCGGESTLMTAGISGTGIVLGVITGFGSIFVNGVEYDIDQADIDVDSEPSINPQDKLAIGMVVRLSANDNEDGVTGQAVSVVYDDAIEGPVSEVFAPSTVNANQRQFTILGQTVLIDSTTTTFYAQGNGSGNGVANGAIFSFDTIAVGDVIEVSGFADSDNQMIIATRVEKKVSSGQNIPVELHGVIENLDLQVNQSFVLAGVTVDISSITAADLTDLADGLKNGQHVEVNGVYISDTSIRADQIEGEDDDIAELYDAKGTLSLQGVVTTYTSPTAFKLNGIQVDASSIASAITMQIKAGIQIQVKGQYSAGVLTADKLELRSGEAEFYATISSIDDIASKRIEISYPDPDLALTVSLLFDQQSQLVDDSSHHSRALTLAELEVGMQVKVQVKKVGNDWVVVSLKHDDLDKYKIRGYVTEIDLAAYTVVINGLTIALSDSASYEIDDHNRTRSEFFNYIDVDDPMKSFIDLEDEITGDGLARFLEVELDTNH